MGRVNTECVLLIEPKVGATTTLGFQIKISSPCRFRIAQSVVQRFVTFPSSNRMLSHGYASSLEAASALGCSWWNSALQQVGNSRNAEHGLFIEASRARQLALHLARTVQCHCEPSTLSNADTASGIGTTRIMCACSGATNAKSTRPQ